MLIGAPSTNNLQIDVNGLTVLSGGAVKLPDYGSVTTPPEGMIDGFHQPRIKIL